MTTYPKPHLVRADGGKPVEVRYGRGLVFRVTPAGTKIWRCIAIVDGKRQKHILGRVPDMKLEEARAARDRLRDTTREGHDPRAIRRAEKAARLAVKAATVETVGKKWLAEAEGFWSPRVAKANTRRLQKYVFPVVGSLPIVEITRDHIRIILELQKTKYAQALLLRGNLNALFDYAVSTDLIGYNPLQRAKKYLPSAGARANPARPQPYVASIEDARAVLAEIERPTGHVSFAALLAHRLIALTACRKVEALEAEWCEVDMARGIWTISAKRTKQGRDHIVQLSPQALEVFEVAARVRAPGARLAFPRTPEHDRPLDDSGLNDLYSSRGLRGRHTPHGWRSTFTSILNSQDHTRYRLTDFMLGHKLLGASAAAGHYDHADYSRECRALACIWADSLLVGAPTAAALVGLEAPQSNVTPLRGAA